MPELKDKQVMINIESRFYTALCELMQESGTTNSVSSFVRGLIIKELISAGKISKEDLLAVVVGL